MRENSAKDERIVRLREDVSKTGIEASTANMLDLVTQQLLTLEEQTIFAHRAAEDVLELLAFEEKKYADLSQANRELANKLGQSQMELDISGDEKAGLQGELIEACRDLEVTQENARLWQVVAEKRLNERSQEEQIETKAHALQEVRKQLEQASKRLNITETRTGGSEKMLQISGTSFNCISEDWPTMLARNYSSTEQIGRSWKKISDENEESKAKLEAFEQRFAAELEREPCDLPEIHMHTSPSRKRLELKTLRRHWR